MPNPPVSSYAVNGPNTDGLYGQFYVYAQYQWYSSYWGWVGGDSAIARPSLYNNADPYATWYSGTSTGYYCYL